MPLDEVGQELVHGNGERRRIDHASLRDERVQFRALLVGERVGRAFGSDPDAHSLRDAPDVEQHTAHEEDLEALAKRSFAARTLCQLGHCPVIVPDQRFIVRSG